MCGICGRLSWSGDSPTPTVEEMARTLRHRGPDKDGFYEDKGLTIGYTRLSIIDLETGDQPMANEDESVWLVHNGELYNYKPLRARLKEAGHRFRTRHHPALDQRWVATGRITGRRSGVPPRRECRWVACSGTIRAR